MSSFKNFAPTLTSLQAQADGTGTIAGSPLEDFLSIAGYETPGGGGGGSSDFSTATFTIIGGSTNATVPMCVDLTGQGAPFDYALQSIAMTCEEGTYTIALYKGAALVEITSEGEITLNGDIQEVGAPIYAITGDCTITVSS